MENEYFKLSNIKYEIKDVKVHFENEENGIRLYFDINAISNDNNIDNELSNIYLYHNNGFQTGVKTINELKGKKYIWSSSINENDEDAGILSVLGHEDVTKGTIEIIDVSKNQIRVKWYGTANVFWNEILGENVPFETEFVSMIPKNKKICINAYRNIQLKIDDNCKIELLNFHKIKFAAQIMQLTKQWKKFNAILKFKITYDNKEYFGKVIYKNGKNNYETVIDNCPVKIKHCGFEWSKVREEFNFLFEISGLE